MITVRLHAGLRRYTDDSSGIVNRKAGISIKEMMQEFDFYPGEVMLVTVNKVAVEYGYVCKDGDYVEMFPIVGGG
jgi:molybdopterin converting factor small subunit